MSWIPGGGAGGGGAAPGAATAYPTHQMCMHKYWLHGSNADEPTLTDVIDVNAEMYKASTAGGGLSPYATTVAYDPDADLADIRAKLEDFVSDVSAMDSSLDVGAAIEFAVQKIQDQVVTDADITETVNAFESRQRGAFARAATRLAAGMFDIGAVMTSQFHVAMSNLEADRQADLNDADKQMRLEAKNQKLQAVMAVAQEYLQHQFGKMQAEQMAAAMQDSLGRLAIAAKQDEVGFDLEMLVKDRLWNLDLFPYANNVMSSIAGSSTVPHPTKWDRMVDNASQMANTAVNWRAGRQSMFRLGADYIGAFRGNRQAGASNLLQLVGLLGAL